MDLITNETTAKEALLPFAQATAFKHIDSGLLFNYNEAVPLEVEFEQIGRVQYVEGILTFTLTNGLQIITSPTASPEDVRINLNL